MLQLRRIRLESVGHPNARFAPLQLRLTGEDNRPTHTVLWLRNGGGKSSLLNLIFAVVRPNRREFLGSNDDGKDRRLADYVLAGDTSHVCLEWGQPGARTPSLVTGMCLEWRDRARSSDESRLRRLWYAFVPSDHLPPGLLEFAPTLTFDTLPITQDDRRLSLTRVRERLRAIGASDPSLQLVTPTSQAEWRREIERHDLDPEVLRYQLQMNREEGGASELFKRRCRTESDFVDLLLELAVADEQSDRVADVYVRYADELASRPDVERNREFLRGALQRLEPVVTVAARRATTAATLRDVLGDVVALALALRRAAGDAITRAGDLDARAREHEQTARDRDGRLRTLRAQGVAVRRHAAHLEVLDAERLERDVTKRLGEVDGRLAAVALLEPLARSMQLQDEITTIDRRLHADQPQIAQDLEHARSRLHARLAADEATQRRASEDARQRADHHLEQAAGAEREAQEAVAEHARAEQARVMLAERADARRHRRQLLVERGLVEPDEDARTAHGHLLARLDELRRRHAQRERELSRLDEQLRNSYVPVSDLDDALVEARARLSERTHDAGQLTEMAAALVSEERLQTLSETTDIDIFDAGPMLVDRLDGLVADADRRLAEDAVAQAADRAGLAGLQADGLLPARRDVAHVLDTLARAGIAATSGWRHIATRVRPDDRDALIARMPAIADGVVVADTRELANARDVVANMADPLSTIVVVAAPPGTPAPADQPGPTAPPSDPALVERPERTTPPGETSASGAAILAPVDAALYDRARGEQARVRLRARIADADRRQTTIVSQRARDAALADRLRRLLSTYPPETRTAIADAVEGTSLACGDLRAQRDTLHDRIAALHERRTGIAKALADAPHELGEAAAAVADVASLVGDPADDETDGDLAQRAQRAAQHAAESTVRAQQLRAAAAELHLSAQRHRAEADQLRDDRLDLSPTTGDVQPADAQPADVGDEPLEVLVQRVRTLSVQVETAVAGSALGERRRLLLERRADVDRELAHADGVVRQAAVRMLRSADGATRNARAALLRATERERDAALAAHAQAGERLRAARASRDQLPDDTTMPDGPLPESLDATRELERRLLTDADHAADTAGRARADAERAHTRAHEHRRHGDQFAHMAELLAVELRGRPDVDTQTPPDVPDDPERARAIVDELRARLAAAADDAERATRMLAQSAAEVRRFVTDARFASLDGPIRARLSSDPVAVVAGDSDLVEQLEVRLRQCEDKLEELTRHRRLLVREIATTVQRGLWLLRQAEQVSSLPAGFGDWSQQRFLHIRFATPAVDDDLVQRLETMVDELVDEGVRPSGIPLLQRATHAAVGPTGFRVRIFKPNPALHPDRVPVTELATFSGGEQLTAAILLYCTLARLRAQARSAQTAAGMLTLDNPIGKSSNVTLLRLQRRVADAMGVQLVYTTAVDDREAVSVLPHWVRLRNDRGDTRTGNQHVEVADQHNASDEAQFMTTVSATHVWRRTDEGVVAVADPR